MPEAAHAGCASTCAHNPARHNEASRVGMRSRRLRRRTQVASLCIHPHSTNIGFLIEPALSQYLCAFAEGKHRDLDFILRSTCPPVGPEIPRSSFLVGLSVSVTESCDLGENRDAVWANRDPTDGSECQTPIPSRDPICFSCVRHGSAHGFPPTHRAVVCIGVLW